jgi:hypothetical protein
MGWPTESYSGVDAMTKLHELSGDDYLSLPKLSRDEVKVLSFSDFWDGMLNGLIEYEAVVYWCQMCHDYESDDQPFYRRFLVIELSAEQLAEEQYWDALFMEKIGTHLTGLKPKELWNESFEPSSKRKPRDFSSNEVVGWFEEPLPDARQP